MSDYTLVIVITFIAFAGLAALLLVPVYRFLKREEKAGKKWSDEHRRTEPPGPSPNGADSADGAP